MPDAYLALQPQDASKHCTIVLYMSFGHSVTAVVDSASMLSSYAATRRKMKQQYAQDNEGPVLLHTQCSLSLLQNCST